MRQSYSMVFNTLSYHSCCNRMPSVDISVDNLNCSLSLQDLDFREMYPEGILLQHELYDNLLKTIERDCRVLESFHIMDYSLLIGVHNLDVAARAANTTNLEE